MFNLALKNVSLLYLRYLIAFIYCKFVYFEKQGTDYLDFVNGLISCFYL